MNEVQWAIMEMQKEMIKTAQRLEIEWHRKRRAICVLDIMAFLVAIIALVYLRG